MPLIDDQGRVFGRVNLIDALAALFVLGLVPLVYGAFLLFKTPVPVIETLTPAEIVEKEAVSITVTGTGLRPFLHARIGSTEAAGFLVQTPTLAEIKVPASLAPGTYDVALFDEAQELTRKAGAITVVPPPVKPAPRVPRLEVQVVGAFIGVKDEGRDLFKASMVFEPARSGTATPTPAERPLGEVLALREPERGTERLRVGDNLFIAAPAIQDWHVPAILRVSCAINGNECRIGDVPVAVRSVVTLPFNRTRTAADTPPAGTPDVPPTVAEQARFQIAEVRQPDAKVEFPTIRTATAVARVRFVAPAEVADLMKAGDVDMLVPPAAVDGERAVLTELSSDRQTVTATNQMDPIMRRNFVVQQPVTMFGGTVRVPVTLTPLGWTYKERTVKVGAPFYFETPVGGMAGWIVDLTIGRESRRFAP